MTETEGFMMFYVYMGYTPNGYLMPDFFDVQWIWVRWFPDSPSHAGDVVPTQFVGFGQVGIDAMPK
jgi:hypothetical protein